VTLHLPHVLEHGLGGGQKFGVGDVVGDFGGAYAGGRDEGAAAAAPLFVAGGERDQFFGVGFEGWDGAVAFAGCVRLNKAEMPAGLRGMGFRGWSIVIAAVSNSVGWTTQLN
jgi:hypothetical protein